MSEEGKLMTNRQLSQLCAKGLCEWRYRCELVVHSDYEYQWTESDETVSEDIIIRPFEDSPFTNADSNEWYTPSEITYNTLINNDRTRHILGF